VGTNYETICKFVNSSLKIFPGIEQRVLHFISDAGTYMVKAAKTLKIFYPKLIHITCLTHAVNRVLEKIPIFVKIRTSNNDKNLIRPSCRNVFFFFLIKVEKTIINLVFHFQVLDLKRKIL